MTGSALTFITAAIRHAPDRTREGRLCRRRPFFGSCWGLEVAVTAAGERCAPIRGAVIRLCPAHSAERRRPGNPLFAGKPRRRSALHHLDEIASLPAGAATLAVNDFGVQAAIIHPRARHLLGGAVTPGVRLRRHAAAAERYGETLVKEGCSATRRARGVCRRTSRPAAELLRFGAALEARAGAGHAQRGACGCSRSATGWEPRLRPRATRSA